MRSNRQFTRRCRNKRRSWASLAINPLLLVTVGCSRSPVFNILGSYFPSWLVCIAAAVVLTFLAHIYITRRELAGQLWPQPIVYSALLCLFSCTLWLIFFR
jgi:hypothetical protein